MNLHTILEPHEMTTPAPRRAAINFAAVNRAAVSALPTILARLAPGGKIVSREYIALNPTRGDRRPGSFKVHMFGRRAGAWSDFATGARGGDPVSLVAYLEDVTQAEAARFLGRMLGIEVAR